MSDLIKDFSITAFIMILGHWVYGIEDTVAYDFLVEIIVRNKALFVVTGFLGSATVMFLATMFQDLMLSQVAFILGKFFARMCQFFIIFLSILNIIFYTSLSINFIQNSGYYIVIILVLTLGASCWALRIIDFNHHTRNALVPAYMLVFMSVVLVEFVWPFYGI
jgi:hypothetical protein